MIIRLLAVFLCASVSASAAPDATSIVAAVKAKLDKVSTYKATVRIKVDVPFMKVPDADATVYFKAPDRTAIESKGFAMLPKQSADLTAMRLLSRPYVAIDVGTASFQGQTLRKIKVLPSDDAGDIVVATKKGGTVVAELVYGDKLARTYALPSYVKLVFDIGAFEIPKTMSGDFDAPKQDNSKPKRATVELQYSNYTFNKPIPDKVFK
jgi:hypothetical protein